MKVVGSHGILYIYILFIRNIVELLQEFQAQNHKTKHWHNSFWLRASTKRTSSKKKWTQRDFRNDYLKIQAFQQDAQLKVWYSQDPWPRSCVIFHPNCSNHLQQKQFCHLVLPTKTRDPIFLWHFWIIHFPHTQKTNKNFASVSIPRCVAPARWCATQSCDRPKLGRIATVPESHPAPDRRSNLTFRRFDRFEPQKMRHL